MLEISRQIAELFELCVEDIRVWPIMNRYNNTVRPLNCVDLAENAHKNIMEVSKQENSWLIFVETSQDLSFSNCFDFSAFVGGGEELEAQRELQLQQQKSQVLPPYNSKEDVMLFFKFYDPKSSTLRYVFRLHLAMTSTLSKNSKRL